MFSRIHWNLLSALNSLLNFPWYTKFRFPHCHKVTKESQELTLINCKLNECHFFSTVHLPVCFFAGLFFTNHLPSLHPAISTSTSNWTEIKFFLIWALKSPHPFLKTFIYSLLPPDTGRNDCPVPQSFLM